MLCYEDGEICVEIRAAAKLHFLSVCAIIIFRDFHLCQMNSCFFLLPRNKVFFHDFEDKPPQLRKKVLTLLYNLRR